MKNKLTDFCEIEDSKDASRIIGAIVAKAFQQAAVEAKTAGLALVFVRGNQLVRVAADGQETILKNQRESGVDYFITKYKKGTVFHPKTLS